jgi:hypothetical protein
MEAGVRRSQLINGQSRRSIGEKEQAMAELNDVLFEYVAHGNPKPNEDLKRFLRRFPEQREEIIDFTATWRAMSILETTLPAAKSDPLVERNILKRAQARWRVLRRRHAKGAGR